MKISTEINKKKNMRLHIVKGVIDINELTEYLKEIYNSLDFDSGMNVLWDLRKADFSRVSTEEVWGFKKFVADYWGKGGKSKAALVVSHDSDYVMSIIYQNMIDKETSSEILIFKDIEKAKEWIEAET